MEHLFPSCSPPNARMRDRGDRACDGLTLRAQPLWNSCISSLTDATRTGNTRYRPRTRHRYSRYIVYTIGTRIHTRMYTYTHVCTRLYIKVGVRETLTPLKKTCIGTVYVDTWRRWIDRSARTHASRIRKIGGQCQRRERRTMSVRTQWECLLCLFHVTVVRAHDQALAQSYRRISA